MQGQGYAWTPGIHSQAQIDGWRTVTEADVVSFTALGIGHGMLVVALAAGPASAVDPGKVLVVEKEAKYGGTTARSGGVMWLPDNPFMKRDGVEDSFEQASATLRGMSSGSSFSQAASSSPDSGAVISPREP